MRNLFSLTVTVPNRRADPCLRAAGARSSPSHHLIFFDCFFKDLQGIVSTLPRVSLGLPIFHRAALTVARVPPNALQPPNSTGLLPQRTHCYVGRPVDLLARRRA